jgi:hypothetical protein
MNSQHFVFSSAFSFIIFWHYITTPFHGRWLMLARYFHILSRQYISALPDRPP